MTFLYIFVTRKMKKLAQKSAILLLSVLLIMATGGFSIYHHFCQCAGESSTSIFLVTNCEHDQELVHEPLSCCSPGQTESCCMNQPEEEQGKACQNDDCCNTSSTYLKIFDNFTVSIEKISFKFMVSCIQILTGTEILIEPQAALVISPELYDTSPPLYGTDLLHYLHQLKTDHLLV